MLFQCAPFKASQRGKCALVFWFPKAKVNGKRERRILPLLHYPLYL